MNHMTYLCASCLSETWPRSEQGVEHSELLSKYALAPSRSLRHVPASRSQVLLKSWQGFPILPTLTFQQCGAESKVEVTLTLPDPESV
jgi:hypothetical protein